MACMEASMETNTPEYRTFQSYFSSLLTAVRPSVMLVAREAFSKSLISKESMDSASNEMHSSNERASKLLLEILDRIKVKRDNFEVFISILQAEPTMKDIADQLMEGCKSESSVHSDTERKSKDSVGAQIFSNTISFKCCCGKGCSLDTFVRGECREQLEGHFPYLDTKQLTERDKDQLIRKLVRETNRMIKQFENLTFVTFESLKNKKTPVDELMKVALNFGQSLPRPYPQKDHSQELSTISSVNDVHVFLISNKYISFFNYRILEQIIKHLGTPADEKNLQAYLNEYGKFCKRSVFEVPSNVWHVPTAKQTLCVKVNESLWFDSNQKPADTDFTLDDIYAVEDTIAELINISPAYIILKDLKQGCIELSFEVLVEDTGLIQKALHGLDPGKLLKYGITVIESEKVHNTTESTVISEATSSGARDDSPLPLAGLFVGQHSRSSSLSSEDMPVPKRPCLIQRPRSRSSSTSSGVTPDSSLDDSDSDSPPLRPVPKRRCLGGGVLGIQPAGPQSLATTYDVEMIPYVPGNLHSLAPMTIADAIKTVTEDKYDKLTRGKYDQPNAYSGERMRKVLASVVMERKIPCRSNRLCIVSLGAGSKSIGSAHLTKKGTKVHDCHAEVLARRGLLRFLYSQLENVKNKKKSIFEKKPNRAYALKNSVSFHLFISKPPCGDASVFGLHELHENRLKRGIARVTPADGEGAVHISWPPEEDKTFASRDARLFKMCCSAKIARWNVIGVQGALLSLYIEPVYFSSITIGSDFNTGHMSRAVYGRVSKIQGLPSCYRINSPNLYHVSIPDNKTRKSHKISLNWHLQPESENAGGKEELIECLIGKTDDSTRSCLSKKELFKCFTDLCDRGLGPRAIRQLLSEVSASQLKYCEVKALAVDYQCAKAKVAGCFASKAYGSRWLKMPPEVDQFCMDDSDDDPLKELLGSQSSDSDSDSD